MKFFHAADLHLDAPLRGLSRYEGAPTERIRKAGRGAFDRLVDGCLGHKVDFLLLAGDLFDGSGKDFNTVLYLAKHLGRLKEAGIAVFAVLGNHDAENSLLQARPFPDNVHLFGSTRAETISLERLGVAIHGQSYSKRKEKDNLVAKYPPAAPGMFNIGLLHTALTGRSGHESYAPCNEDDLLAHGYQYWALGHVHQRELVRPNNPTILFPGTIQGRHIHESGDKGATLVEVDGKGRCHLQHVSLDLVRWQTIEIKLDTLKTHEDLLEQASQQMESVVNPDVLTAVRLQLTGQSSQHGSLIAMGPELEQELRVRSLIVDSDALWLERIVINITPVNETREWQGATTETQMNPLVMIRQIAQELREDHGKLLELAEGLKPLRAFLGSSIPRGPRGHEPLPLQNPQWLARALTQAEILVQERLLKEIRGDK